MRKILQVKKGKKQGKRTRIGPKKAKPGAFWVLEGMGTVEDGSNQMRKPSVRTKVNHKTMQHMKKENRRKPSVFAGFVAGAEGLVSAAASVGAGRSPQATSAPRHALRRAQPCLVAKSYRTLTKKSGTAEAIPDFFGRGRRTRTLGTRFWSGCGGVQQGTREGAVSPGSPR